MGYFQIFDEIVNIMKNDYSGCRIKKDWGKPEHYRQLMKKTYEAGELDRKRFKEIVDDYLLDFMDHHVVFRDSKLKETAGSIGFKVRRYEDVLYVISTDQEKNIKIGMQITELDDMLVKEAAEKFHRELLGQPNERQLWEDIIIKCETITVTKDGKINKFYINRYPDKNKESRYECKWVNDNTILLTYNDFMDYQQSQELLAKHGEEISSSKNLIVDIRQNSGGYDTVFLNLLDYIFPENFSITDKYGALTNITERNYNNRMEMLSEFLKQNLADLEPVLKLFLCLGIE
jgi:C-terminal processing protease CtpA/Prc